MKVNMFRENGKTYTLAVKGFVGFFTVILYNAWESDIEFYAEVTGYKIIEYKER